MYNANDNMDGETALLLTGAKLATLAPEAPDYGLIEKGALLLRDGLIAWAGPESEAPAADAGQDPLVHLRPPLRPGTGQLPGQGRCPRS